MNTLPEYKQGRAGRSKLFHVETMRRIIYNISDDARAAINATTQQGRLFPQALSDAFGTIADVHYLVFTLVQKHQVFYGQNNGDDDLLVLHVFDSRYAAPRIYYFNLETLRHISANGWNSFHAHATAEECVRLYREERGPLWD